MLMICYKRRTWEYEEIEAGRGLQEPKILWKKIE